LVRVFHELGVLQTICDSDKKVLKERLKVYPEVETTTNFSEVLNDKAITAVVIAAPAATHYTLAKQALLSGKDLFVEKPLALNMKEGEELVTLAKKEKRILMVGHLLLYHPAIVKLKGIIKRGELGTIRYVWSHRLNFGKLRREENVFWSFAPHDISVIIDLLGLPNRVSATGKAYVQKNVVDITLSALEYKHGESAHIFVSWLNPFKEQKLTITGSKKMAVYDGVQNELVVYPHIVTLHKNKNPEAINGEGEVIKCSSEEPLMEEAKHFVECVQKRKVPKTDGKKALDVLRVLEACQKSLNKNGTYEAVLGA